MPKDAEIDRVGNALEEIDADDPEVIAQSTIPYNIDDSRAQYLAMRASGFKIREALQLVNKHKSTLTYWRKDPEFVELERTYPEYGKRLSIDYVWLAFMRNLVLVGILDYRTLNKAINNPDEMTPTENQYLVKLRTFYTPQHLRELESLVTGSNGDGKEGDGSQIDFTKFVIEATRETIKIESRNRSGDEPTLPKIRTAQVAKYEGPRFTDDEG